MPVPASRPAVDAVRRHARPLVDGAWDDAMLLDLLGRVRFALLGEASYGTHEFLSARAAITRQLITVHGYRAVVIEADWLDALRVNRYVRVLPGDADAVSALSGFPQFPAWLWRHAVMLEFVQWLRAHNDDRAPEHRVGFYGLDRYGLYASIRVALDHLDRADPYAAQRARLRYGCFDHFQQNLEAYGFAAGFGTGFSGEDAVVAQLLKMNHLGGAGDAGTLDESDAQFHAGRSAKLDSRAELYYRHLFKGRASSWNLRSSHMADTLQAVDQHLSEVGGQAPRIAVWAHNAHLGDATATLLASRGEWNVGALMRQRHPHETALVGFTSYGGSTVSAAHWNDKPGPQQLRPALSGSWEELFHAAGHNNFLLMLRDNAALAQALRQPLLQRATGVIHAPENERQSHYFEARLAAQFDAVIHIDETSDVQPVGAWGPGTTNDRAADVGLRDLA